MNDAFPAHEMKRLGQELTKNMPRTSTVAENASAYIAIMRFLRADTMTETTRAQLIREGRKFLESE